MFSVLVHFKYDTKRINGDINLRQNRHFRKTLIVKSDFSSEFPRFARLRSVFCEYSGFKV